MPSETPEVGVEWKLARYVIYAFIIQLILNMLAWGVVVGWTAYQEWRIKEHHTDYRLLDDYTRGRIDHLPYKPRDVDPEPTEEE